VVHFGRNGSNSVGERWALDVNIDSDVESSNGLDIGINDGDLDLRFVEGLNLGHDLCVCKFECLLNNFHVRSDLSPATSKDSFFLGLGVNGEGEGTCSVG